MSKIRFEWITGKRLMERWNLDLRELHMVIENGLPVYNPDYVLEDRGPIYNKTPNPDYDENGFLSQEYIVEKNNLYDLQVLLETTSPVMTLGLTKDQILSNLLFKTGDVENFEKEHGRPVVNIKPDFDYSTKNHSDRKIELINGTIEKDKLSANDARELGRLRNEKTKWDDSISAALKIGLLCGEFSKDGLKITRARLADEIFKLGFRDLANTTIDKIWRAIPEKFRKKAGRPQKR